MKTNNYKQLFLFALAVPALTFAETHSSSESETDEHKESSVMLPTISVTSSTLNNEPGTTTQTVDTYAPIQDLFDNTPGVDFSSAEGGVIRDPVIRGIGGPATDFGTGAGRVPITIDGIQLPPTYKFGHDTAQGLNYFDTANLKSMTVHRGPTVSQTVTGVGGVIALRTINPEDILLDQRKIGLSVKAGYDGRYNEKMGNISAAWRTDIGFSGLFSATRRNGHEVQTHKELQSGIYPFKRKTEDLFTKVIWDITQSHHLTLSMGRFDTKHSNHTQKVSYGIPTNIFSSKTYSRHFITVQGNHFISTSLADNVEWSFNIQKNETDIPANTIQNFAPTISANNSSTTEFTNKSWLASISANKIWQMNQVEHTFQYGVNVQQERIKKLKTNGTIFTTPASTNVSPTTLSTYFPDAKRKNYSLFISDSMKLGDSGVRVIPSLKYQYIHTKPYPNTDILDSRTSGSRNSGLAPLEETYKDEHRYRFLDASLLTQWKITTDQTLSLNLVKASRSPGFTESNASVYGHWPLVPNINLKPEKSQGISFGWNLEQEYFRHELTLSTTYYKDMILATILEDPNNPTNGKVWLRNEAGKTKIYAIEYSNQLNFGIFTPKLSAINLSTSLAWAKGKNTDTGEPVTFIAPLEGQIKLAYVQPKWNTFVRTNFAAAKKEKDIAPNTVYRGREPLPGYATLDIGLNIQPTPAIQLSVTGHNMLNKKYIRWSDAAISFGNDRNEFWQPSRAVSANVEIKF